MAGPGAITQRTTSGAVSARNTQVYGVVLTAGSDAATLELRDGASGGTLLLTLKAAANTSQAFMPGCPFVVPNGVYLVLAGTGPVAAVVTV